MIAKAQHKQTATDSLFGMALAQAFTGFAFGIDVDMAWEACEATSTLYKDRFEAPANKNAAPFDLGVKKSLGNTFHAIAGQATKLEKPFSSFDNRHNTPSPSYSGFSLAA